MVQFFVLQMSYFTCLVSDGAVFCSSDIMHECIPLRLQCSIGHSRHRADEYGVFFINFTLSYGYFQSVLGWLCSILLAHFWYVRIMLNSIRDSAGEKDAFGVRLNLFRLSGVRQSMYTLVLQSHSVESDNIGVIHLYLFILRQMENLIES
jgi:hypothetical protein